MYGWIWRTMPGGLPGKLVGSFLLVCAVVFLLFFYVFPAVEPLLPFNDVTVESDDALARPGSGTSLQGGSRV